MNDLNEISTAIEQRDIAIKTKLADLEKKNQSLADKNAEVSDRVFHLEQMKAEHFDDGGNYGTFLKGGHKYDLLKTLRHISDPGQHRLDGLEAETNQEYCRKMVAPMPGSVWLPLGRKSVD